MFCLNTTEAGQIDFPEFLRMTAQRMHQHGVDDETREAFRVFAKDDKGHIPIDELRYVSRASIWQSV